MGQTLSTGTFGVATWVVSPDPTQGTHTTIQSAINDASSGDSIWIRDGTYSENITGKTGVTLQCITSNSTNTVFLDGSITVPTGVFTVNGLTVVSTGSPAIVSSGSGINTPVFDSCDISAVGAITIANSNSNASSVITSNNCDVTNTNFPIFTQTGVSSGLAFTNCQIVTDTATLPVSTIDGGALALVFCTGGTGFYITGTSIIHCANNILGSVNATLPVLTIDSTSVNNNCTNSAFIAPGIPVIVNAPGNFLMRQVTFQTNAAYGVSGTGTINYCLLTQGFAGSTTVIDPSLTASPIAVRLGLATNFTSISVGDSPYTVLSTDEYLSVDSSGGPITILFPDTPIVGQTWTVKDASGTAAANNITVTTVSGTDNIDGSTTSIINLDYESINLIGSSATTYEVY